MLLYYAPIRASNACLACHQAIAKKKGQDALAENDLLAVVRIRMPTKAIEDGVHFNRAILISTALVTALLIMAGSYLIVRYVIVKPVKHLKEVSDAISAGELNVRSEIQTGDEFEDLSHAFNRMLRNLVSMQDQWRKVNADLDRKVDELAQANMALYESNRLKSDFLATMSHELRTPLNSILGFSEVLLSERRADRQAAALGAEHPDRAGRSCSHLINDILDLAKIEAGKMQVRLEEFSLHDVCEGLLNMFRPLAEKKNIDLRGQLDPDIPMLRQDVDEAAADPVEPAVQRDQVHAGGRPGAAQGGGRHALRDDLTVMRHRRRHRAGGAGAGLREVPPVRQPADARARRHRPGPVDRPRAVPSCWAAR